mgnify:CR=1 FL=1
MKELELYLHIPFCERKCAYCDFLSAPADLPVRISYIKKLQEEIAYYGAQYGEYQVSSIFLGGGTPTILEGYQLAAILETVKKYFRLVADAEITVECNPGTLTAGKAEKLVQAGFNRLSMGLQSADDRELQLLGRIHNFAQFLESYDLARKAGFRNINVDLMSGIPFQTLGGWEDTLKKVAELGPEHISAYSLIIEEGTPFYEKYGEGERAEARRRRELPDEDTERMMYQFTKNILWSYGYHRYEISNYAKEGYECRHNLGYWNRTEYLGIGTGAASLINNQRFVEGGEIEVLSLQNQMEEYMFLGLRKIEGVSKTDFRQTFGRSIENAYGKVLIDMYQKQLLEDTGEYIRLTEKGIDVSNYVMSEFLF